MICHVFRSGKKTDTYLYIPQGKNSASDEVAKQEGKQEDKQEDKWGNAFVDVPPALLNMLGKLEWVMDIDLASRTQLAQVDCTTLIEQLNQSGYFLQLPPSHYQGA